MAFQLAACAEMLWRDKPIDWRASRLKEMGFGVGLWNWPAHVATTRTPGAGKTARAEPFTDQVLNRKCSTSPSLTS